MREKRAVEDQDAIPPAVVSRSGRGPVPWAKVGLLALLVAALLVATAAYYFRIELLGLWELLADEAPQKFRNYILGFGPYAPLVFIAFQLLQVVISPFPGEISGIVGGLLFGVVEGTVLSTIGLTLGSWLCFFLGRALGRPFVEWLLTRAVVSKFDFLLSPRGTFIVFLCFLMPGFPKDYLSYLMGLSHMRTITFLLISGLGRIPGTLLLSLQGAKVAVGQYRTGLAIAAAGLLLAALLGYFRGSIHAWLARRSSRQGSGP